MRLLEQHYEPYLEIPENEKLFLDIIIKNVRQKQGDGLKM